ncbi:protein-L-isoaspartate(D-aspartate) O-methyltransferase [Gemmatimonadota bacterium]
MQRCTGYILIPVLLFLSACGRGDRTAQEAGREPISLDEDRQRMVEVQLRAPGREAITDPNVLRAMLAVPRHEFLPESLRYLAYIDDPLPIGHNQTISQPYIVALMTQVLELKPGDRVLEIGTGSGYQAAVLSEIVAEVYSIEIVQPLAVRARETLDRLEYENVFTRIGDGYRGWPEKAPFDAIIVTAAPDHVPQPLVDQLTVGGRMVVPVGSYYQELLLLKKGPDGNITRERGIPVRFVQMTGEAGNPPPDPEP